MVLQLGAVRHLFKSSSKHCEMHQQCSVVVQPLCTPGSRNTKRCGSLCCPANAKCPARGGVQCVEVASLAAQPALLKCVNTWAGEGVQFDCFFASRNAITKQRGVATALLRASSLTDARENKHNHMLTNRGHTLHFFEMQMGLHEAGMSMMCCFWSADTLSNDSIAKSDQSIALMPRRSSPIFWHRPRLDAMCANKLPRLYRHLRHDL